MHVFRVREKQAYIRRPWPSMRGDGWFQVDVTSGQAVDTSSAERPWPCGVRAVGLRDYRCDLLAGHPTNRASICGA